MGLGAVVLLCLVGLILYWKGRERGEYAAEGKQQALDLWRYGGTASVAYFKVFPEMALDSEWRRSRPDVYAAFRRQAEGPNPIPYLEWVRANYADHPINH
jgi:hypothetical protein